MTLKMYLTVRRSLDPQVLTLSTRCRCTIRYTRPGSCNSGRRSAGGCWRCRTWGGSSPSAFARSRRRSEPRCL